MKMRKVKLLGHRAASVTNSNEASEYFEDQGLGLGVLAEIVKRHKDAKLYVFDKFGNLKQRVEDTRAQLEVARLLMKVHGVEFLPVTKPAEITIEQATIIREVNKTEVSVLVERKEEAEEVVRLAERLKGRA